MNDIHRPSTPDRSRPLLTILIPAYNEAAHLRESVDDAREAADQLGLVYEIVIIDDCSTDATLAIAHGLAEQDDRIRCCRNAVNLGLGATYKRGLELAKGEFFTWVPSDRSHPPAGLVAIWRAIGTADIVVPVVANREVRSRARRIVSRAYTVVVNMLFGLRMPYYNGLVVHRTDILRSIPIRTDSFAFQTEALVRLTRRGHGHVTTPTEISERAAGHSSAFRLRNLIGVAMAIARLFVEIRILGGGGARTTERRPNGAPLPSDAGQD